MPSLLSNSLRLALVLSIALPLCAQEKPKANEEPRPDVPMAQWLAGPDHADFRADFKVLKPRLTYQQRLLVECRAAISGEIARGRSFHMWLKVSENSAWLPGDNYVESQGGAALTKANVVQFVSGFYARPGKYTVAIVIFDSNSRQYDIRHLPLTVEAIKADSLPATPAPDTPSIEFLDQPPTGESTFDNISDVSPTESDSLWEPSKYSPEIPLPATRRPLQIDVVLNFADHGEVEKPAWVPQDLDPERRPRPPWARHQREEERPEASDRHSQEIYVADLMAISRALARIHPANGCVRFSGIDITAMKVDLRRELPDKIDWEELRTRRSPAKGAEVSVAALKNRKDQPIFVRDFLQGLLDPIAGCGTTAEPPLHAVLFISHRFKFPDGARREPLKSANSANFRLFYFQMNEGLRERDDDLESYLKSMDASVRGFQGPRRFREILARTLSDLTTAAK